MNTDPSLMYHVSSQELECRARGVAFKICELFKNKPAPIKIYGVPRGGVPAAYLVANYANERLVLAPTPESADVFVDDLIDTGHTMNMWNKKYPGRVFIGLYDKQIEMQHTWIVFPWEGEKTPRSSDNTVIGTLTNRLRDLGVPFKANDNISAHITPEELTQVQSELEKRCEAVLRGMLIDIDNDHNTRETARRMAKMYMREVFGGRYEKAPKITDFPNVMKIDQIYTTGPISIRSCCSHHLCPILGKAWVGVYPGERVIGLSKFNRLVDHICRRPQIQEEMAVQVANAIEEAVSPKGLAVIVEATHTCMTWRGVRENPEAVMTSSVMRGLFLDNIAARQEFLSLIK